MWKGLQSFNEVLYETWVHKLKIFLKEKNNENDKIECKAILRCSLRMIIYLKLITRF
jgi:hypothetical protein